MPDRATPTESVCVSDLDRGAFSALTQTMELGHGGTGARMWASEPLPMVSNRDAIL
jgi:hypothetical protein